MGILIENKEYIRRKIKKIPSNAKIILYRNPKEFSRFNLEGINPTHKIILWGKLKKKYRRGKTHYIQAGKILIPSIMLSTLNLDIFIKFAPAFLISFIAVDCFFIACHMGELYKCLSELKAVLVQGNPQ